MKASKKLLAVILAVVVGAMVAGCGGSSPENQELNLGVATGWDENQVIANLTKILLEEELGYGEVRLTELELGPVFEGVGSGDQEAFAFVPWRPHWMNARYDFKFLEDPEDALQDLNDGATISSIVNEDLPDEDPVAYAFMENLKLTEEQVNEIENINPQDYGEAARTWLEDENNRNSLQPAVDAAREAQES